MIDYFLKFADENAALSALQSVTGRTEWPMDYAFPGLQFWRDSQDTIDAQGNTVHTFLSGYFVMLSLKVIRTSLVNAAAVQIVIDRELARTRSPGAVIKSNVGDVILQDLRFSPVPAGSDYPFGNLQ